jgi:hypothetical protein
VSRTLARVFAGWRTGLSGSVIVLQAGTAVNYFGTGLILPFEIIYLHQARGFSTATAGLVLAAVWSTAAVVTPSSGALLDRFRAKPILITGNLASALGYTGFAFVDCPWQAFVCPAVGGAGFGVGNTANQVLSLTLVSAEQRVLDRAPPSRRQLRSRQWRDGCGLHHRLRPCRAAPRSGGESACCCRDFSANPEAQTQRDDNARPTTSEVNSPPAGPRQRALGRHRSDPQGPRGDANYRRRARAVRLAAIRSAATARACSAS